MFRRNDPRLRRTLNELSQNLENANESAQETLFSFGQNYVNPCFASVGQCWSGTVATCFPNREERLRRGRGRSRGRAELSFDFYDDWEQEEDDSLLGWGNDGLDRLLGSGGYGTTTQPNRERGMNYGTRKGTRRGGVHAHEREDPTIIPSSSYFGFLGNLPFRVGRKGLRYKPSAADLTEHPGALRHTPEEDPLIEEDEEDAADQSGTHKRARSGTHSSGHTTDSYSSRGDIFPSEDELDDAIPIDDEFAMVLERRNTGMSTDEASSGKTRGKRPSGSRVSLRTESSLSTRATKREARGSTTSLVEDVLPIPTLTDLKQEEEMVQQEEEASIERKRDAAKKLAAERGFTTEIGQDQTIKKTDPHPIASEPKPVLEFAQSQVSPHEQSPFPTANIQEAAAFENDAAQDGVSPPSETVEALPRLGRREPTQQQSPPPPTTMDANTSQEFVPARLPHFVDGPT